MSHAFLTGPFGPTLCWEPRPGFYLAAAAWSAGEAAAYAAGGVYPARLLESIQADAERQRQEMTCPNPSHT